MDRDNQGAPRNRRRRCKNAQSAVIFFLHADSLQSSHPISVPVGHPDAINEIFDSISYGKGASVIRMMENFLGLEAFNTGITDYLNKHKFGNAKQVSAFFLFL